MDTKNSLHQEGDHKESGAVARQGAAIVGFVAIAIIGLTIAVYAARFVPGAIGGIGSAAAYLSSIFVPSDNGEDNGLVVVPQATTTPAVATSTKPVKTTPVVTATSTTTTNTPAPAAYYGSADLTASIIATGYCASRSQNSFVASSIIPSGAYFGGASFMFTNIGTNIASGAWQYRVETSTGPATSYGVSLRPGQSAAGVVCFDRVSGTNYVQITADTNGAIAESNESNNTTSRSIASNGSGNSNNNSNNNNSNNDLSCDIDASDTHIEDGDTTVLEWDSTDADSARINQGIGTVNENGGTKHVHPSEDTVYRMTVEDEDGNTETCSVSIRVDD